MNTLRLECPAKINLFLELHGRRPDGYHELTTVMLPVNLCDQLTVRRGRQFSVRVSGAKLSGTNTVEKAYQAITRQRKIPPVQIEIRKRIPPGAGLGGGSSNAAATIIALDRMFDLELDRAKVAAEVGSDVPFFLHAQPALCTGRGENIHLLPFSRSLTIILFSPPVEALTAEVYAEARNIRTRGHRDVTDFLHTYSAGSIEEIRESVFNRLEEPAFARYPTLRKWKKRLGPGTHLTGSGSTFFQLHSDPERARSVGKKTGGRPVSTLSPFPRLP